VGFIVYPVGCYGRDVVTGVARSRAGYHGIHEIQARGKDRNVVSPDIRVDNVVAAAVGLSMPLSARL